MKKIIFTVCCIISLSVIPVSAQHAITQAQFPFDITKTIVKEHTFPNTVSYVETTGAHYFAYADASMVIVCHEIDKNIFVQDFKIFDDVVYFCGYDVTSGCKGVWGYFNVLDLMNNIMSYSIYMGFNCEKPNVDTLHSIVVYEIQNAMHIVTVGTTIDKDNIKNGCTIEITPSTGGTYAWDYTIGVTPDYSYERIKFLCETSNYIVTAGSSGLYPQMETYRVHRKINIFSSSGPQDDVWFFSYSTYQPYLRNTNKFVMTHTQGDNVAIALQSKNINASPNDNFILLYEYDMSTLSIGAISTMNPLAVSTMMYPLEVEGLVYSSNANSLSLLLSGNLLYPPLNGYGSIVAEVTLGSSLANLHGLPDIGLYSIDNYNFRQNYVCLGVDVKNNRNAIFYTQPLNVNISCTNNTTYGGQNPTFLTKMHTHHYKLCTDSFDCIDRISVHKVMIPNNIKCQ